MSDTILGYFIGGKNDGRRVLVPDLPIIHLAVKREAPASFIDAKAPDPYEVETYRREILRTHDGEISFYVLDTLRIYSALRHLLRSHCSKE